MLFYNNFYSIIITYCLYCLYYNYLLFIIYYLSRIINGISLRTVHQNINPEIQV